MAATVLPGVREVQDQVEPYAVQWQRSNLRALTQPGPLWVALGDSMTQGIGASAYDRGWVGQLADALRGQGRAHRIVNLATSGARVQDVLDRQLPTLEGLGRAVDLVTVLIGSNDMVSRQRRGTVADQMAELLSRLPEGAVVANLPNPSKTARAVNEAIDRAVTERHLVVANMRQPRVNSWRGRLAADHFHPNDAGYAGIAAVFGQALGLPPAG